jgi:putative oxidoreductase
MLARIQSLVTRTLTLLGKIEWTGPLLARLTLGLVFVTTGWGKLHSLDKVIEYFTSLGIPAAHLQAPMVATIEFAGGALLLVGLGTRVVSALLIGTMAVAIYTAKLPDTLDHLKAADFSTFDAVTELVGTVEFAYLVMFAWLVVRGAGALSVDRLLARRGAASVAVGVPS